MTIRINKIIPRSYTDGPGLRTVLIMQRCHQHCPGCQSPHTWAMDGGAEHSVRDLAKTLALLANGHGNVTISGGEPFAQPYSLCVLLFELRKNGVKHIIVYTGYKLSDLQNIQDTGIRMAVNSILCQIDVLVDGPFIANLDHDKITWRGSSNQRVIDVPASIEANEVITLDWDSQFTVTPDGDLVMPLGFADEFAEIGASADIRRCGQSK